MKQSKALVTFLLAFQLTAVQAADNSIGVLGTPADGSTVSGVGVISGYHCTSKNIEVFVDGISLGPAGAGTTLKGTQGVCGRTDTGYSLLYAFNNLSNGQHIITVKADGVQFDSHIVTTFQSGGQPWLSGKSATFTLPDFPQPGQTATVRWVESYQNFLIVGISSQSSVNLSPLNGSHNQYMSRTAFGAGCAALGIPTAYSSGYVTTNISTSGSAALIITDTAYARCTMNLTYQSGNATSGFDLTGTMSCTNGLSGNVGIRALKRWGSLGWDGYMNTYYPQYGGCSENFTLYGTY